MNAAPFRQHVAQAGKGFYCLQRLLKFVCHPRRRKGGGGEGGGGQRNTEGAGQLLPLPLPLHPPHERGHAQRNLSSALLHSFLKTDLPHVPVGELICFVL